jgi:ArsR family transcriptional regulator
LSDETRLRILNLLAHGPLCVCHFQSVLQVSQVKISKHLRYLKSRGLVESTHHQNWRIYRLANRPHFLLDANLQCLEDCIRKGRLFQSDLNRLKTVAPEASAIASQCCKPNSKPKTGAPAVGCG